MSLVELLLFGVLCYFLGLVSGAIAIPWFVDPQSILSGLSHDPVIVRSPAPLQ